MFSKDSILHDINILSKFISLILVIISIILCNIPIFYVIVSLLILVVCREFKYLKIFSDLLFILSIVICFYQQYLWIIKLIVFIIYLVLVKKVTRVKKLRYLLEVTLYRYQNVQFTYIFLYNMYFVKYYKNNFNNLLLLKKSYSFKGTLSLYRYIIVMSYRKTRQEIKELVTINSLRFYNVSPKRTYLEDNRFEIWDICYLLIHFTIFVIVIIMSFGGK